MVSSHFGTPLGVGTSHGHFGPRDTPRPGLGGSHHLPPYSILCDAPPRLHPNGSFSRDSQVGVPKLSRNCLEIVPVGVPRLWELITPDCKVWSRRGLNQTCSPRQDLFNDVSHSQFGGREEVDSRLLVVGSQTANLTPGPSFAHNLGYRCPNDQCEAIFDIYASRPFQWHLGTPQWEVFWALLSSSKHSGIPEDSKSSLFPSVGFTPTLGQSRVATLTVFVSLLGVGTCLICKYMRVFVFVIVV